MAITLEVIELRLAALEREISELKIEVGRSCNLTSRGARLIRESQDQHTNVVARWRALRERFGIQGQPIGAKQLRKRLIASGMTQDGSAFSRELIAMREE